MKAYLEMEMPESCSYCPCMSEAGYCNMTKEVRIEETDGLFFMKERPDWCPIKELPPHGRLIDADALLGIIKNNAYPVRHGYNEVEPGMTVYGIQQAVDEAPTVDAKPAVYGKWQTWNESSDTEFYSCDICGCHSLERENFCPYCGADMRGEKDE